MKPLKSAPNRELEMLAAKVARDALRAKLGNRLGNRQADQDGKIWAPNGRRLGFDEALPSAPRDQCRDADSLNQWMIDNGLGKPDMPARNSLGLGAELQHIVDTFGHHSVRSK